MMRILRTLIVAACLTAALPAGAGAVEYKLPPEALGPPTSPPSQPAEPPPPVDEESEPAVKYNACFGERGKEPTLAFCRQEVRRVQRYINEQERRYLKTGMGYNVGSSLVGCADYCRERYSRIPAVDHGAFWSSGECKVQTKTMCFK